jgi:hypothetical protein
MATTNRHNVGCRSWERLSGDLGRRHSRPSSFHYDKDDTIISQDIITWLSAKTSGDRQRFQDGVAIPSRFSLLLCCLQTRHRALAYDILFRECKYATFCW